MPKVLYINPHHPGRHGEEDISVIVQMPLNLGYLIALTPDNWEKDIIDETIELAMDENGDLTFGNVDLVALTSVTYQSPRAYKIAEACKRAGITTVIGGVHVSTEFEEAMNYCDAVCKGEAEYIWGEILSDFEKGELKKFYDGGLPKLTSLTDVEPDREFLRRKYDYKFSSIITTKGCPFRCDFCSVPMFQGRVFRERPVEDVWKEMESTSYHGLMLAEDNFYGYSKSANERARKLFTGMVERGIWKDWFGFTTLATGNDPVMLDAMAKSGCFGFLVGLESNSEEVLKGMQKDVNLRIGADKLHESIKSIHDAGMIVWGSVIFGADGDDKDCFKRMVDYILENSIDTMTYGIYCPMPRTALFKRLHAAGRIFRNNFPDDWYYYDSGHLVHRLSTMTLEEFIEGMQYVYDNLYNPKVLRERFRNSVKATGNPRNSMFAYRVNQDWDTVYKHNMGSLVRLYESGDYYNGLDNQAVEMMPPRRAISLPIVHL